MPAPSVKLATVSKVIYYDEEKKNTIIMTQPADWQKAQLKVMGKFDRKPVEGETLKISGTVEKEPWTDENGQPKLSKSGNEMYNYVMKKAAISEPGEEMTLRGKVERVLYTDKSNKNSIVLARRGGWKHPMKVYAPAGAREGDFITAHGFKEKEFWQDKEGKQVMNNQGEPGYNIVLRADKAKTQSMKEYSGPISKVFSYNEESHNAIVLFNPGFSNGKDVKAYVNLPEAPVEGLNLTVSGITDEEISEKDGKEYTNLVIRGFESWQSPAEAVADGPAEDCDGQPFEQPDEDEDNGPVPF